MKGIVVSGWLAAGVCGAVGGCMAHDAQGKTAPPIESWKGSNHTPFPRFDGWSRFTLCIVRHAAAERPANARREPAADHNSLHLTLHLRGALAFLPPRSAGMTRPVSRPSRRTAVCAVSVATDPPADREGFAKIATEFPTELGSTR